MNKIAIKKRILIALASSFALSVSVGEPTARSNDETLPSVVIRFSSKKNSALESSESKPNTNLQVPDIQRHIIPLIGKLGCNARNCHGSFQGRGGLALSLFGFDFAKDHAALTGKSNSESGHRINKSEPEISLLLRKATEQTDHEGGQRFTVDSWQHEVLRRWIKAGAPNSQRQAKLLQLDVNPQTLDWNGLNHLQSLTVIARWSDGTAEDVTPLARLRSNDDSVVRVLKNGKLQANGFGDTHIIVFYDNGVQAIPARVIASDRPAPPWPTDPLATPIDGLVNQQLKSLGIVPSPVCTDEEFLRRLSIDLTGTLPPPQEVLDFLKDRSPMKRVNKIDEMLERPTFSAWWATKLSDFTGCNPQQQAELGQHLAEQWYMWIYQRLREKTPYDKIVAGILLAQSRNENEPAEYYYRKVSSYFRDENPLDFSASQSMPHYWSRRGLKTAEAKGLAVAHNFLGIRLQCAECHKHPWDQWTQKDFRQFSEFFSSIKFGVPVNDLDDYKTLAKRTGLRVQGNDGSPIRDSELVLATKGQVIPWREVYLQPSDHQIRLDLLQSRTVTVAPGEDPRKHLMQWLREKDNPWFAKAIVNRVWASCFHAGIVNPPDDLNPANPPSNPKLLAWLTQEFVKKDYDLRWLLKEITRSATWQRSCQANSTNRNDSRHFSRSIPRRIPAEVVYDGIKQAVCGTAEHQTVREDLSRRAVGHLSMRMAGTYAMQVFGKPQRSANCDCERVNEPSLLQAVFLQNDPLLHLLLEDSKWLKEIENRSNANEDQIKQWIREAWLRCNARKPKPNEAQRAWEHVSAARSPREGIEDLLWSLINTREFLLNH